VKRVRGADRICAHVFDGILSETEINDVHKTLRSLIPTMNWKSAFSLFSVYKPDVLPPLEAKDKLTFRVTAKRHGQHHNFTSQVAMWEFGAAMNDEFAFKGFFLFLSLMPHPLFPSAKMKNFDMETWLEFYDESVMVGIVLHDDMLSKRNRSVLGRTTLNSAISYLLLRLAGLAHIIN